jgi:hypothetical protein
MTRALVVTEGPDAGRRAVVESEILVGREGAVGENDAELSRRHAVVRVQGEGLEIEDLGSLNGTYVNGDRIVEKTVLGPGDKVKMGQTVFEVERDASRSAKTVASPSMPEQAAPLASAPSQPFGAYAAATPRRGHARVASRLVAPTAVATGAVVATAIALVAYFAQH